MKAYVVLRCATGSTSLAFDTLPVVFFHAFSHCFTKSQASWMCWKEKIVNKNIKFASIFNILTSSVAIRARNLLLRLPCFEILSIVAVAQVASTADRLVGRIRGNTAHWGSHILQGRLFSTLHHPPTASPVLGGHRVHLVLLGRVKSGRIAGAHVVHLVICRIVAAFCWSLWVWDGHREHNGCGLIWTLRI